MGNKKKVVVGIFLALSLAGLTACGNKASKAPVVDQTEVATSGVDAGTASNNGSTNANGGSVDNGTKPVDTSKLVYAKSAEEALKAFTRIVTEGAKVTDKASVTSKVAPTADDYGKGLSTIQTDVPFSKVSFNGATPTITITAESGKYKCSTTLSYSTSTGSKITGTSCK